MRLKGVPDHPATEWQSQDSAQGITSYRNAWEQLGMKRVYSLEDFTPGDPDGSAQSLSRQSARSSGAELSCWQE